VRRSLRAYDHVAPIAVAKSTMTIATRIKVLGVDISYFTDPRRNAYPSRLG
jgi:hypothetical protein